MYNWSRLSSWLSVNFRCILRHWLILNLLLGCCCNKCRLFSFSNFNFLSCSLFNLFLLDDFLFLNFVLPFFFLSLTHFNDSFHNLFLLLIYLLVLFLFFSQRHFHCLFHQLFFSSLLSFNHLLSYLYFLRLLCRSNRCWILACSLRLLRSCLLLWSLTR